VSLVIVEGPDGAGKTTLINKLVGRVRWNEVHHHGAYLKQTSIARHYMRSAYRGLTKRNVMVVMDRSWLAEPVYGSVMRRGENRVAPWQRRMLERVAMGAGAVVVLCRPALETCRRSWAARLEREYPQKIEELMAIHAEYAALAKVDWAPVITYDYEADDERATMDMILNHIEDQRRLEPTIGAHAKDSPVLLIGDRPGGVGERRVNLPFVSLVTTDATTGCSAWLTNQLEEWGVPEKDLAWANQENLDLIEFDDIETYRKVIALGGYATAWCEQNYLRFESTYHPQYWKRFHHYDPYPLRELIR
jgi:thymidylate kinase